MLCGHANAPSMWRTRQALFGSCAECCVQVRLRRVGACCHGMRHRRSLAAAGGLLVMTTITQRASSAQQQVEDRSLQRIRDEFAYAPLVTTEELVSMVDCLGAAGARQRCLAFVHGWG